MGTLIRSLRWPVTALLITGALHFTAEAIRPDLRAVFTPATLGPILLVYGLWAGHDAARRAHGFGLAVVAGAILGLLPAALDTVGFGILLGRGLDAGAGAGAFGWLMIVFGSLAGGGVAMSRLVVAEPDAVTAALGAPAAVEQPA